MIKKLTLNQIINLIMFFYILSIYLFTYHEQFNKISNGIALVLIGLIWTNFLFKRSKFKFNNFLFIYLLFIIFSLISIFYAIDQNVSLIKCRTLVLLFILMISLVNYLDTQDKIINLMKYFAVSGFIASIYILLTSDFSEITRFGEQLGNVNTVGMMVGISSVFCLYFILEQKKYIYIAIGLTNLIVILLTGSRKSLLFIVITLIVLLISRKKTGMGNMIKILLGSAIIIFTGFYIINNVPILYQIMGSRMENLLSFILGKGITGGSLTERYYMIQVGFNWFKEKPLTGYGIDNFQFLFSGVPGGRVTYSHNNFIELLVGIGLFGTSFYYIASIVVIKSLVKASKAISKTLCYSFLAIITGYLFMSVGLVYYYDKHISILMAVGSTIYRLSKIENKKLRSS